MRVGPEGEDRSRLTLTHICPLDDHWQQDGPGAAGVGWDLGLLGLAVHLSGTGTDRFDEELLTGTAEGKRFIAGCSDDWRRADIAAGEDPAHAEAAARLTAAFYSGEPPKEFGITQAGVPQHLRVLGDNGFASVRIDGPRRIYVVDSRPFLDMDAWLDPFHAFWEMICTASAARCTDSSSVASWAKSWQIWLPHRGASRRRLFSVRSPLRYGIASMSKSTKGLEEFTKHHKGGSLWAKGTTANGVPTGYWEWYRKDGTKLRSGHFENGEQVGEWTTYDKSGEKYKVTQMRPKANKSS